MSNKPLSTSNFSWWHLAKKYFKRGRYFYGALTIIILVDLCLGFAYTKNYLTKPLTLGGRVQGYVSKIQIEQPRIWFLGNSILNYGVNGKGLEASLGQPVIKLAHGSASVYASASLFEYYREKALKDPKLVVLFATKDDFNKNGLRSKKDSTYLARKFKDPFMTRISSIFASRLVVKNFVFTGFPNIIRNIKRKGIESIKKENFDGKPIPENSLGLLDQARDFKVDGGDLDVLIDKVQGSNAKLVVILMPVTDRYHQWHDDYTEGQTSAEILNWVKLSLKQRNISFLDITGPSKKYEYFQDPYHLNEKGKKAFELKIYDYISDELSKLP